MADRELTSDEAQTSTNTELKDSDTGSEQRETVNWSETVSDGQKAKVDIQANVTVETESTTRTNAYIHAGDVHEGKTWDRGSDQSQPVMDVSTDPNANSQSEPSGVTSAPVTPRSTAAQSGGAASSDGETTDAAGSGEKASKGVT